MIEVSKSIYLSWGIQYCIYKNPNITQSHSHTRMCHFCLKELKSDVQIKAIDMILVPKSISTRVREFNDASRKILKYAMHDCVILGFLWMFYKKKRSRLTLLF